MNLSASLNSVWLSSLSVTLNYCVELHTECLCKKKYIYISSQIYLSINPLCLSVWLLMQQRSGPDPWAEAPLAAAATVLSASRLRSRPASTQEAISEQLLNKTEGIGDAKQVDTKWICHQETNKKRKRGDFCVCEGGQGIPGIPSPLVALSDWNAECLGAGTHFPHSFAP